MRLCLALLAWIAFALPAQAACEGQDLRATLSDAQQSALDAALAATPYAEGNHWRATRGDEVIHLVGTIHLNDPRLQGPIDTLRPVVESAGRLLLEMTPEEERQLNRALASRPDLLLLTDTTLPELLSEEDWQTLSEAMRARQMPPFVAAKFQPWYVSMLLSMPPCMMEQIKTGGGGLDKALIGIAEAAGVPMRALEPFDTGFRAFNATPRETQIAMMRMSITDPGASEDQFATMAASYFEERAGESWHLTAILAEDVTALNAGETDAVFAALETSLLDARNRAWINVILDAAGETDGPLVAAFGAAHLQGDTGVLRLLEIQGFTLERRPF